MQSFIRFIRTWMLAIGIIMGTVLFFLFVWFPSLQPYEEDTFAIVKFIQPWLIFTMLFVTFCKVDPKELKFNRWMFWLAIIQVGCFSALALPLIFLTNVDGLFQWYALRPIIEGGMLCLICPTATAAAVVTGKLGGSIPNNTTYTIIINLIVALIIPTFVPLLNPDSDMGFFKSFFLIIGKVFPLLFCPFLLALVVRYTSEKLLYKITHIKDLALYIWAFGLTFAIMVSVKSIWESHAALWILAGICIISAISCVFQFWAGRKIGQVYNDTITAGQALGQKNTVFLIWCGYTFFDPLSSIAGGFYSVFHNLWNSYQLARIAKK